MQTNSTAAKNEIKPFGSFESAGGLIKNTLAKKLSEQKQQNAGSLGFNENVIGDFEADESKDLEDQQIADIIDNQRKTSIEERVFNSMSSAHTYQDPDEAADEQTTEIQDTEKRKFTATTAGQISQQQSDTIYDQEKLQSQSHKLAGGSEPLLGDNSNKIGFVKSVKSFLNKKRDSTSKKGMGIMVDENQEGIDIDLSKSENISVQQSFEQEQKVEEDLFQQTRQKKDSKKGKRVSDYMKRPILRIS